MHRLQHAPYQLAGESASPMYADDRSMFGSYATERSQFLDEGDADPQSNELQEGFDLQGYEEQEGLGANEAYVYSNDPAEFAPSYAVETSADSFFGAREQPWDFPVDVIPMAQEMWSCNNTGNAAYHPPWPFWDTDAFEYSQHEGPSDNVWTNEWDSGNPPAYQLHYP